MSTAEANSPTWSFGARLHMARRQAGLNQGQVASRVGVSRPQVGKWERDEAEPRLSEVKRLAVALGVPFAWLADESSSSCFTVLPGHDAPPLFDDDLTPWNARPTLAVTG